MFTTLTFRIHNQGISFPLFWFLLCFSRVLYLSLYISFTSLIAFFPILGILMLLKMKALKYPFRLYTASLYRKCIWSVCVGLISFAFAECVYSLYQLKFYYFYSNWIAVFFFFSNFLWFHYPMQSWIEVVKSVALSYSWSWRRKVFNLSSLTMILAVSFVLKSPYHAKKIFFYPWCINGFYWKWSNRRWKQ